MFARTAEAMLIVMAIRLPVSDSLEQILFSGLEIIKYREIDSEEVTEVICIIIVGLLDVSENIVDFQIASIKGNTARSLKLTDHINLSVRQGISVAIYITVALNR